MKFISYPILPIFWSFLSTKSSSTHASGTKGRTSQDIAIRHKEKDWSKSIFSKALRKKDLKTFEYIAMHSDYFTTTQYALAMLSVPVIMTLTEAYSPHTWDTPFLMFTGYVSLLLIMQFFIPMLDK